MNREDIIEVLGAVCYPETGKPLEAEGMIGDIEIDGKEINVTLLFTKATDPFLASIRRDVKDALEAHFGDPAGIIFGCYLNPVTVSLAGGLHQGSH